MRVYTFVNLKPGTAKTTSAVWLAQTLHEQGRSVLYVDADPAASGLAWSDLVGGFPWRIVGLPTKDVHRRIAEFARPDDIVIIDAPQLEDRAAIARACMRAIERGDEGGAVVVPVAPSTIELDRMGPMGDVLDELDLAPRAVVLLNRVVTGAASGPAAREVLTDDGWRVVDAQIPRREIYATSFGTLPLRAGLGPFQDLADELLKES